MMQQVATAATTGGRRNTNPSFNDPQVRAYTAKLRERIQNLADKDTGKSLLLSDALQYYIKPKIGAVLASNPTLQRIWAPIPTQRKRTKADGTEIKNGSPHWSWLLHALASECVNMYIQANIPGIFHGGLGQKFQAGFVEYLRKHPNDYFGVWNYVKRTFSRPIKSWYISGRMKTIDTYRDTDLSGFLARPQVKALMKVAYSSRTNWTEQNNLTPGKYIRDTLHGVIPAGLEASASLTAPSMMTETATPITHSVSSSSSSSNPEEMNLSFGQ